MTNLLKSSQPCDECGSSDAKAYYEDNEHCFSCGHHVNYERNYQVKQTQQKLGAFPDNIPVIRSKYWCNWFRVAGIDPNTASSFYICVTRENEDLVVPYYRDRQLFGYELRMRSKHASQKSLTFGTKIPTVYERYGDKMDKRLIVCEDIRSALKLCQIAPTLCLHGTNLPNKDLLYYVDKYTQFYLMLDPDTAGQKATKSIEKRLRMRVNVKSIPLTKDPKWYSDKELFNFIPEETSTIYKRPKK